MGENYSVHEYDVLVIGAGGAGLRAAIEASSSGATVAIISKSMLGKAHTVMAEGGAAAALANKDERDSWKTHFRDTMKGGKYLNDWRMARIHAQQAPDRIREFLFLKSFFNFLLVSSPQINIFEAKYEFLDCILCLGKFFSSFLQKIPPSSSKLKNTPFLLLRLTKNSIELSIPEASQKK